MTDPSRGAGGHDASARCTLLARVNVKAQAMLNGAAWLRERFGDADLARVLSACSPAVRERVKTGNAIAWHPAAELDEFLTTIERTLGRGDGKLAEAAGAAAARVNLRRMGLRIAFFLARPEFIMRRVAGVWRQYNDAGEMRVLEFANGRMVAELVGVVTPSWACCASISGWLAEAALAAGLKRTVVNHVECRSRGHGRCVWYLRRDADEPLPVDVR
jgi:predicted hydrocarbon binding protein